MMKKCRKRNGNIGPKTHPSFSCGHSMETDRYIHAKKNNSSLNKTFFFPLEECKQIKNIRSKTKCYVKEPLEDDPSQNMNS